MSLLVLASADTPVGTEGTAHSDHFADLTGAQRVRHRSDVAHGVAKRAGIVRGATDRDSDLTSPIALNILNWPERKEGRSPSRDSSQA